MTNPQIKWVLSLDGGGVRGLSSLVILEDILNRADKHPHHVFNLVCGTSAGGISALMIGRVAMNISKCVREFRTLSKLIFGQPRAPTLWGLMRSRHDAEIMVKRTQDLLQRHEEDPHAAMHVQPEHQRRANSIDAYVVCLDSNSGSLPHNDPVPVCLGTCQRTSCIRNIACRVWEAVRATSAAPTYFDPQQIMDGLNQNEFLDGGIYFNNPIITAREAIMRLDPGTSHENIGYISIGTGYRKDDVNEAKSYWHLTAARAKSRAVRWLSYWPNTPAAKLQAYLNRTNKTLEDVLGNARTEGAHEAFEATYDKNSGLYFRFNCDETLEEYDLSMTPLDKHEDMDKIEVITREYLRREDVSKRIQACANMLRRRDGRLHER